MPICHKYSIKFIFVIIKKENEVLMTKSNPDNYETSEELKKKYEKTFNYEPSDKTVENMMKDLEDI